MIDELTLSAWHEAGHAVAYLDSGRRFRYITLRPRTPSVTGMVVVRPRRIDWVLRAVIAQAGPMAQGRYELAQVNETDLEAEGLEREDVMFGAYLNGGHGDHELIEEAERAINGAAEVSELVAGAVLDRWWPAVERIAGALIEIRSLSYADAVRVAGVEAS